MRRGTGFRPFASGALSGINSRMRVGRIRRVLVVAAVASILSGCGGGADTASTDEATTTHNPGVLTDSVARDTFAGYLDAFRENRFDDAAEYWSSLLQESEASMCATPEEVATALQAARPQANAWAGLSIVSVTRVANDPFPQAVFAIRSADGATSDLEIAFALEDDEWKITDPYPIEAGNLCFGGGSTVE